MAIKLHILAMFVALVICAPAVMINQNYTICSWARLRVGVIRDILYLDGGELWWQKAFVDGTTSDPTSDGNVEGDMYLLNFSKTFDTGNTNLSNLFTTKQKAGGAANNIAPNYIDGMIFANNDELYLYGGLTRNTNSSTAQDADEVLGYEAYQYGPYRESWEPGFYQGTLSSGVTRYITNGAGVTAASENLGFYFSGMRASDWGPIYYDTDFAANPANTLIEVDMTIMRSEKWANYSLPSKIVPRANAELVWLPVSNQGVLVAVGGVTTPEEIWPYGLNSSQEAESKLKSPAFMTNIPVYDILSKQWYLQNTTGTPPSQLTEFCSVLAIANDTSSFNIYIYGGYDGLNAADLPSDDVWILSVPSFHWVKAYSGHRSHGRSGHKCVSPYPDQMFVVGGVHQSQAICVDGIVQVFNLNNLEFQDSYTPTKWARYQVPSILWSVIGGDAQGGATKTATWSDQSLSKVFQTKYTGKITNYYPYQVASNTTSTDTASKSSKDRWLAPILGTVLGLLVIGTILFAILFARRRKLLRRNSSDSNASTSQRSSNRYIRWVNGIPVTQNEREHGRSNKSSEAMENLFYRSNPSNDTNFTSLRTSELAGSPRHEMSAAPPVRPIKPPVELPTSYHDQGRHSHQRNIDYTYDQPALGGQSASTPSAYRLDDNHSSPFSPDDVNRDSDISHRSLPSSSSSPLLYPAKPIEEEDGIPPVPAISWHKRQVSTMSSGLVSPLTPVDEGKSRFRFD